MSNQTEKLNEQCKPKLYVIVLYIRNVTTQTVVIDTHTNPPVGEPLLQPKSNNMTKYYTFKDTKAGLNDNKNGVPINSKGLNN